MRLVGQLSSNTPRGHTREALKRMILARGYQVGDKLPTYRELAEHFGVALFTVERVMKELARDGLIRLLHGKGAFIKQLPATTGQLRQIGLIFGASRVHLFRYNYLVEILGGLVQRCDVHQIDLQILSFCRASQHVPVPPRETAARIDGAILLGTLSDGYVAEFAHQEIPLVLVDGHSRTCPVHSIVVDNAQAVDLVMDHLYALGHRRIAYMDARSCDEQGMLTRNWVDTLDSRERREAYLAAMRRLGLGEHQRVYANADIATNVAWRQTARDLLQDTDPPTALLAYDTYMTSSLYRELCQAGWPVLQRLSLAGVIGAQEHSAVDGHEITCARVMFEDMGKRAVDSLVEQASGQVPSEPLIERIATVLTVGTTTAPPRA